MHLLNIKIKTYYFQAAALFLPIITYTPFFFTQSVNPFIRIGYFSIISLFLFFSWRRFSRQDLYIFGLLVLFILLIGITISSDIESILSAGNYCLIIFFGWSLFRYLSASKARKLALISFYETFFYIVVIFSFLSLIFLIVVGEYDLFGFKSETYSQLVTPFGVHFKRVIGDLTVYRSFFYFVEAAHLAIFYAANIIIVAPLLKDRKNKFVYLNVLGGILSFSITFYVVLFALYAFKKIKSFFSLVIIFLSIVLILILILSTDLLSYSSSDDRIERFLIFFILMDQASLTQILFGHGILYDTGFDKAFNSGLSLSIFETGVIGTIVQLLILWILCPSLIIFVFFMLSALVVDPIHMPIFWFLIIVSYQVLEFQKKSVKTV